jgi:hypothetical protein
MFMEILQRFADAVCGRDSPCLRATFCDINDVKSGKVSNLLRRHMETYSTHNRTRLIFVLGNFNTVKIFSLEKSYLVCK